MAPDPRRLTADERAYLVADLDGKLDESGSEAIATKLTAGPARTRTAPPAPGSARSPAPAGRAAGLACRILAEVSRLGRPEAWWQERLRARRAQAVRLLALAAASVAVLSGSSALTRWAWPDPTARLGRDLSLAEHLDEHQAVRSFEFLRKLDDLSEPELHRLDGGSAP